MENSVKIITVKLICNLMDRSVVFPGTPVSSTNKTDRHNITEILLKVALNTINLNQTKHLIY